MGGGSPFQFSVFSVGRLTMQNGTTIDGDVGTNEPNFDGVSKDATITGSRTANSGQTYPNPVVPTPQPSQTPPKSGATVFPPGSYGVVQANNLKDEKSIKILSGTPGKPNVYVFEAGLSVNSSQADIKLVKNGASFGPVEIYIIGDASIHSIVNESGDPFNVTVFQVPAAPKKKDDPVLTPQFSATAQSGANFGLYAPQSDVKISGGGEINGALVAKTLTMSGQATIIEAPRLRSVTFASVQLGNSLSARW